MGIILYYYGNFKLCLKCLGQLKARYNDRVSHLNFLRDLNKGMDLLYSPEGINTPVHKRIVIDVLGDANPGKIVSIIRFPENWIPTAGFFALFNRALCSLAFADRFGLYPVVDHWRGCPYEEETMLDTPVFEYYFKPVSSVTLDNALKSLNVTIPPTWEYTETIYSVNGKYVWFQPTEPYLDELASAFRNHIRLNEKTEKRLTADIHSLLGNKKTLGIHFRGTDYKLNVNGHPVALQFDDYSGAVDEAMKRNGFCQIFLATDDQDILTKFRKKYGDSIICYDDTFRATGVHSVANTSLNRELHKYEMVYEVLRDSYTLAACDGFIGGNSQVAISARVNKKSKGEKFEYLCIMDKGLNINNRNWEDYYRENLQNKQNEQESLEAVT